MKTYKKSQIAKGKIQMKNIFNLSIMFLAAIVFSTCANAAVIQPTPADAYDLVHENYYIWQANISIPADQLLTSVSICFDNINDWQIESGDKLFISLLSENELNNAVQDKHMTKSFGSNIYKGTDNGAFGNALNDYSQLLTVYEDDNEYRKRGRWINPAEDFTYDFSIPEISLFNSYISGNGTFGIGLDPDCHYYNDGIVLCYETSPVPEPATIAFLGIGALTLIRRKNNKHSQLAKGAIQMKSSKIHSEKSILANIRTLVIAIALLLVTTQYGFADYDDGGTYDISTTITGGIVVSNATTVNALSGANIYGSSTTWGFGVRTSDSFLNIYDGSSITGGNSNSWSDGIYTSNSIINIYGGSISGGNGGWADGINAQESTINIYGGSITGGTSSDWADGIIVNSGSVANIYGGSIAAGSGGRCWDLEAINGGSVNIYGSNFNYDLGAISDYAGTITGILQNGTLLNLTFSQNNPGSIVLIPEPATIALLLFGSFAFLRKTKSVK